MAKTPRTRALATFGLNVQSDFRQAAVPQEIGCGIEKGWRTRFITRIATGHPHDCSFARTCQQYTVGVEQICAVNWC